MAISCSISLRRSPKPGALTHTTFSVPRRRLTIRVDESLALDVLGDDDELLAALNELLEDRAECPEMTEIFLSVISR